MSFFESIPVLGSSTGRRRSRRRRRSGWTTETVASSFVRVRGCRLPPWVGWRGRPHAERVKTSLPAAVEGLDVLVQGLGPAWTVMPWEADALRRQIV